MGRDIRKWEVEDNGRWLIVTPIGINIKRYPAVFKHLKQWQTQLEKRQDQGNHWWELRACAYYEEFEKPKIVFPDIAKQSRFYYDDKKRYLGNTAYIIPVNDLFLLGVLNSSSVWEYATSTFSCLGDPYKGGRFRFIFQSLEQIPIPHASAHDRAAIEKLVRKCLDAKGEGCEAWEWEIDGIVARLYGLSE